ncbi:MAG: M28 family peptidase [Clostridia bacterium]|nr:M28 family peptidase [Clostridia bacterium]
MKLQKLIDMKDQMADWIIGDITHIIKTFEKRDPGSKGELQACEYYAELCEEYGCEEIVIEEFEENPNSFMGWIYFAVTMVLIAMVCYWFAPIVSALLCAAGAVIALLQFGMYKKVMDPFFKKKIGHNMMAIKKPKGEVKQRIFYNGHCDAVWEWPVNYKFGGVAFEAHAIIGFGGLFYTLGISIASMIKNGSILGGPSSLLLTKMGVWGLLFVPFLLGLYFMWNERRIVDGANDNLTGCEMGIAVLKALHDEGVELENTEVGVIICGSEEAGLRGSKAWAEAHKGEFRDVPTIIYSYDTIHDPKWLMANYRDLNGTVKTDKQANDIFMKACEELGIACRKGWVPPLGGATDTAAFAQGGFRSGGVTGLNHKLENYYHTRRDTYDNLNHQGIGDCYAASMKVLEMFENGILYEEEK